LRLRSLDGKIIPANKHSMKVLKSEDRFQRGVDGLPRCCRPVIANCSLVAGLDDMKRRLVMSMHQFHFLIERHGEQSFKFRRGARSCWGSTPDKRLAGCAQCSGGIG
jgi:hypothetical protein